jgi:hypothetical protein
LKIDHLKHYYIDKQQWDFAIQKSPNGLVYALSWYLDVVSPGWNALVLGDYEAVMPLPVKQKFGLKYLVQPPFCQQLGVFVQSGKEPDGDFLNHLNNHFRLINLQLNPENRSFKASVVRKNYELSLKRNYEQLFEKYHKNTKRNVKKALHQSLSLRSNLDADVVWRFKKANPVNSLSEWQYALLHSLMHAIQNRTRFESIGVYNQEGSLIAAAFFVIFKNRITMLVSSSNEQGKKKSAMFLIIDSIIKKYAARDYILDFEGGNVQGLARFFSGFDAKPVFFSVYKQNNLPWPLNHWI